MQGASLSTMHWADRGGTPSPDTPTVRPVPKTENPEPAGLGFFFVRTETYSAQTEHLPTARVGPDRAEDARLTDLEAIIPARKQRNKILVILPLALVTRLPN
jgi:hypothetical protein